MKHKKFISLLLLMSALLCTALPCRAQAEDDDYRFDMGGGLGLSGYLGDANTANLLKNPGWNAEILFRYVLNPRWAFKTNFFTGNIRGNSADMTNVFPDARTFKFSSSFYEIGEMAEFNFFNYGLGKKYQNLKRITPYITAGLGFTLFTTSGENCFTVNIPIGAGVKFKVNKRLNLGLEFIMKKTFSDKIDGKDLSDPYQIKHAFMKNTDWYSALNFTISYEFSQRCAECNYKD